MGFQINITCTLNICKDTGRHFFSGNSEKIYEMPPVVPEEHRHFVKISGDHLTIYTGFVTDEMDTSVENFLDKYPEWSDIVEGNYFEEYLDVWNEDMHDKLYAALKWFSQQRISYNISWRY